MTSTEKINRYIERTAIPYKLSTRYGCYPQELMDLLAENRPFDALYRAFDYGKAKGYRAGLNAAQEKRPQASRSQQLRTAAAQRPAAAERRAAV